MEKYRAMKDHIYYKGGSKTVCVSACLNYFGIKPNQYNYTSSKTNVNAYENVLRRFRYSVRSARTRLRLKKHCTMTSVRRALAKSNFTSKDRFVVHQYQSKAAHLMIVDGNGNTVVDTARGMKWRVASVKIVESM